MKNKAEIEQLVHVLLNLSNKERMVDFLEGILTPSELEEVAHRLQIVKMLKLGVPQKNIAKELGVGIATVTRGSRELKQNRFSYLWQ
ncbi:MAG: YerC/YecD family TrpR-related protein [Patescibacteria group bacterium]|jgi:TrpR family trp operon transcriptional repressor